MSPHQKPTLLGTILLFSMGYLFIIILCVGDYNNLIMPGWPTPEEADAAYLNSLEAEEPHLTSQSCHCRTSNILRKESNSSCSDDLYQPRPEHPQNVVSVSFWKSLRNRKLHQAFSSQAPKYLPGILENLKRMRELYPGYVMRFYTDLPAEYDVCDLLCKNPDLRWCVIRKTPSLGDLSPMLPKTWKFLPLGDPTVDILLVRDLDSVLTEREEAAVADWLNNTTKAIHIMRDHKDDAVAIRADLWGASNSRLLKRMGPSSLETLRAEIILKSRKRSSYKAPDADRAILAKGLFWPFLRETVAHDSYYCETWIKHKALVRPFPVQRKHSGGDFVGKPNPPLGNKEGQNELEMCPKACRPAYGKDWLYC